MHSTLPNLVNESCQWILSMTLVNESFQWILSMSLVNESCHWILSMNFVNESCQWILSMNLVNEFFQWILSMNLVNESCQWIFSMNFLNESSQWILSMNFFNESCQWILSMNLINESSQWIFSMNRFNESFQWILPMNLVNESCQWIFSMNLLNESFQWIFWMNLLNESSQWIFSINRFNESFQWIFANESCQWILSMNLVNESSQWIFSMNLLYESSQWVRHWGLVVPAPAWDETGGEFDSWHVTVSDIYPMFIDPTITWDPLVFCGYIMAWHKICVKKNLVNVWVIPPCVSSCYDVNNARKWHSCRQLSSSSWHVVLTRLSYRDQTRMPIITCSECRTVEIAPNVDLFPRSSFLVFTSWAGVDGQQRMWLQEELQLFDARAGAPVQGGGEHHHGWVRLLQHVRQTTGRPVQPQGQVRRTQRSQMRDDSRRRSQRNLQRYNCSRECFVWTPHTRLCKIFLSFCLLLIFWKLGKPYISYSMRHCDFDGETDLSKSVKLGRGRPKIEAYGITMNHVGFLALLS